MCIMLQSVGVQHTCRVWHSRNVLLSLRPGSQPKATAANCRRAAATYKPLQSQTVGDRRVLARLAALPAVGTAAVSGAVNPWTTLAVLCSCAATAQVAEEHTPWGKMLSAPLMTLLLALCAAGLGLLPPSSAVYDVVWSHLMPLAVALFLLDHDVSSVRSTGGPVLASFLLGAVTMIVGAAAAWLMCKSALAAAAGSTAAAAMLAACLVASYIGGSVNFIAVAAATQLPTGLVPGAMAADNLGMLLLLGLLMAVPLRFLQQQQQLGQVLVPVAAAGEAAGGQPTFIAPTRSSGDSGRSRPAAASNYHTSSSSSSGSSSGDSSDDDLIALDGSPLLTQPPSELEVSACLQDTSTGKNFTRVLPVDVSGDRKKSTSSSSASGSWSSSSSGSDTGSSSDDDLLALDGSPLLTQPPTEVEVQAVLQDNSTGHNFTRVLPINVSGSKRPVSTSNSTSTSSSSTLQQPLSSGAQAAATPGGVSAAAAATGMCGGCRGSGVTAFDDKPLLTRAPAMGDAVSSIAAARQGKPQLLTPPKPPSAAMYTSKQPHSTAGTSARGSSQGYNSERGPDGLLVGCGCCSEALDAIAAASPPPAALLGSSGSSSDVGTVALDGSPLLTSPPSQLEVAACLEATSHGDNQTRVLPVNLSGSKGSSSDSSDSSSTAAAGSIGALALDGSLLLTEEPDSTGLAAAVATARSGGSNGSSVSVSPLMTGEFELLVTLDKDSLLQRLRHQKKKQKKQQLRAKRDAEAVTVTVAATAPASAAATTSSSKEPAAGQRDTAVPAAAHSSSQDVPTPAASASSSSSARGELTASTAAAAVAAAAVAAAVAHQIATALQNPALHQLLLAAIAVIISAAATAVHKLLVGPQGTQSPSAAAAAGGPFAGAGQLGQVLIGVFFAALGASCCCPLNTLACCLPLLAFISMMTATHWALLWGLGGRLLGLQPEVLICGSAAAIGGPATAAGLANARGWDQLVQPSLLCGSLGYALGTGAGLLVAHALGVLP